MHSLSAPVVQPSQVEHSPPRYEAFPPWLVSMVFHMAIVIILGLIHISTTPGNTLNLLFLPAESSGESDANEVGFANFDVEVEAEPVSLSKVDDVAAALAAEQVLTSLDGEWQDLIAAQGAKATLVSAIGGGALGEGTLSEAGGKVGMGDKTITSFFGLEAEGKKIAYVFDRSGSMNSSLTLYSEGSVLGSISPLECAKVELVRSLKTLSKGNEFQIVFYNHDVEVMTDGHYQTSLFHATDTHKQRAKEYVRDMEAFGFTNHLLALETAINLEPDVIFHLTDGEAKDDLHPSVVRRMIKFCQEHYITINVVHFSVHPRENCTLIPLAEETGGKHIFLSLESLAKTMVEVKPL